VATLSSNGLSAISNIGVSAYIILVIYRITQCLQNKYRYGVFINYKTSNLFDEFRRFKYENIVPLLGNGITNLANLVFITLAFESALKAGMNQGVVSTMTALNALYNLFIFKWVFKEKITLLQFLGMLFMFSSVCLISLNGHEQSLDMREKEEGGIPEAYLTIIYGMLSPLSLSIKHIFVRKYRNQYKSWDVSIDGLLFEYQIYIIIAIYFFAQNGMNMHDFILGSIGSLFIMSGKILIVLSVANGIAGPAASLINTQIIYLTLLTVIVQGQNLSVIEIIGLFCGLLGASIISMGNMIVQTIKRRFSGKSLEY